MSGSSSGACIGNTSPSSRCGSRNEIGMFLGTRARSSHLLYSHRQVEIAMVQAHADKSSWSEPMVIQDIASSRNEVMEQQLSVAKTLLRQAVDLLDNHLSSDEQLIVHSKYMPGSTIGKHLRHALDHYVSLLDCLSNRTATVFSYDTRVRDTPMESSRHCAKKVLMETMTRLDEVVPNANPEQELTLNAVTPHMHTFKTTIGREIWFASLHCVHHWSMIRFIAGEIGIRLSDDFGFAPSTLVYNGVRNILISGNYVRISYPSKLPATLCIGLCSSRLVNKMSDFGALPKMTPLEGESRSKRVCYFFDSDIGGFHYGPGHPMKPTRIRMCHSLVMNYGLYKKMEIFRAKPATKREMTQFHSDEYIEFLSRITPNNMNSQVKEQHKYNVGDDCPVFDGLFEYSSISAGGSMEGAARLSRDKCDIAINWAGGLHHAKKSEASGFCYVNDIVLGILELLRYHARVLYIDIDVHHGDGVEEAFYTTDRVMTVSFHKYGEYFPGTGELRDVGVMKGKYYSLNFPLRDGISDDNYQSVFEPVIQKVMEIYDPSAIVLQCGTDSLSGDKLGCLNLSMRGHANCVKFVKSFNKPLLLLGGGGYTMRNTSRAWAYETGIAAGVELGPDIPVNEYYEYFGPDYELNVKASNTDDLNTPAYLDRVKRIVMENLRHVGGPPSVQMTDIPTMPIDAQMDDPNEDEDLVPLDQRRPRRLLDHLRQKDDEFSDSDDEGDGGRRNHARYRDKDSVDSGSHKFGIGGGILTSGHANTHGAGPSAHTTAVQILSSSAAQDMDMDSPPSTGGSGNEDGSSGPAPATETAEDSKSATSSTSRPEESEPKDMDLADGQSEQMSVDEVTKANASSS